MFCRPPVRSQLTVRDVDAAEGLHKSAAAERRAAEAVFEDLGKGELPTRPDIEIDARLSASENEALKRRDFAQMSAAEIAAAERQVERLVMPDERVPTRRMRPSPPPGRIDARQTLRASLRTGGDLILLRHRRRHRRRPPIVVLCDISGSMSRYSRVFLHFLHAITNDRDRVHTFLFGTRLTNVTRYLRQRDIDLALDKVAGVVEDWSGGTRIGATLAEFNRVWSRRVLGQGAVVLFISDGLDRDAGAGLAKEMDRLHKSCRRLVWLNPLLRYEAFEPKSLGMRAILPHVDEFRPVHSLESLAGLMQALEKPAPRRLEAAAAWRERT